MMISRAEIASAVSAYKTVKRKSAVVSSLSFDALDSFERSEAAAALGELFHSTTETFYRNDLVEHLRRQIAEGRYFVPSDAIVEKLLGRLIVEAAVAA
ncbi:MAG TPA: flagellar biosynthesis anti-sigma factor FlgM [Candidatus Elarobacter sp.]|jgi:anti-sigma28 factor (negative regulator of flagellin synthesis)|nr:flagellar biosynthesis anti-sigma factor FlgM [Candidatus Elarobacter sp.]